MEEQKTKLFNVVLMGLSFLLVFAGFNTVGQIQQLIFNSAKDPASNGFVKGFDGDSFTSLAVIYMVFAAANWMAPSFIAVAGPRVTLIIGSLAYLLYMGQLLYPNSLLLYAASVLVGIGAPLLWTAEGNFLTLNSDPSTLTRNSALFWAIFRLSGVIGNIFAFSQLQGLTSIGESVRMTVGGVLLGVASTGTVIMVFLRPIPGTKKDEAIKTNSPGTAFISAIKLFTNPHMLLLIPISIFTGISITFISAVYPTCLGFTKAFGSDSKSLAPLSGMTQSAADILTSLFISWLGHRSGPSKQENRSIKIVIAGMVSSLAAYASIFLTTPSSAPLGEAPKDSFTYFYPNKYSAIGNSLLLGICSACFMTQTVATLGKIWYNNSSPAFAFFKFVQSLSSAVAFFYSSLLTLEYQLAIMVIICVGGTATYCIVLNSQNKVQSQEDGLEEENTACMQNHIKDKDSHL